MRLISAGLGHIQPKGTPVRHSTEAVRNATDAGLKAVVHRAKPLSRAGVLERMFTLAFSKLVYPQIWEDPVVDMKALQIGPGCRVIAIASGGCNVLSYLTADPENVTAVDLNGAHVALGRLKICALQNLPDYETFFRFFGRADAPANVRAYDQRLRARLDPATRAYWDQPGRSVAGGLACSRATSIATVSWAIASAPAIRWRACTGWTPRSSLGRGRSRSSGRSTGSGLRRSSISRSFAG